eukprot:TRINITY_DN17576_c0_g1_i1.p2 TRINITY_DN17576_c0_g1~~TRINITY_DN17576_c0_g1_i1.p2  ORF type:complete len:145 (+),score=31.36 TRINITY_DN17576_c0_g1_i1:73-507(+)
MLFSICQASHSQHPPPGHTLLSLFFSICQASHLFRICQASYRVSILHLVTHCCPCSSASVRHPTVPGIPQSASSTWSHTAVPALQFFSICQASHNLSGILQHLSGIPQSQHPPPESASSTWSRSVDTAAGSPGSLLGVAAAACA